MTPARRTLVIGTVVAICVVAAVVASLLVFRPAIARVARPDPASFPLAQVQQGATLAAIGDCAVCHTADGGIPFAGGRPLTTPFGTLYGTNITPDEKTGIGTWSNAAFKRAMRDGVSRSGRYLYPALPYEHFTHVTDADLDALYAFLMTRRPVAAVTPANNLIPPFGFRPLLAGWDLLFLHGGPVPADPDRSAQWNRGAYLAEGLGHCGSCHTPRNLAGAEETSHAYAGGVAEGWRAPALDASNPAARRWTEDELTSYLRTGLAPDHSAAGGPMAPVVEDLARVPDTDVRAIAIYIASKMTDKSIPGSGAAPRDNTAAGAAFPTGAALFAGACAACHGPGAPMGTQGMPSLAFASDLRDDDPTNTIQVILRGIEPPVGGRGPHMPAFADSLTDAEVSAVAAYIRARFTDRPAWSNLEGTVRTARKESAQP